MIAVIGDSANTWSDRAACARGLRRSRPPRVRGAQVRPLAGHRADAAGAGRRRLVRAGATLAPTNDGRRRPAARARPTTSR
jgi:hypothetical protein